MVKQTKSILLLALVSLMVAFSLGALTACGPGTAGYDWHSGENEIHRTPTDK